MDYKGKIAKIDTLDPEGFRIPPRDRKGKSVSVAFSMMPIISYAMNIMVSSKQFPYKSTSEFLRHAVVRHIRWLENIGDVPSVSAQVEAAVEVLIQEGLSQEYMDTMDLLDNQINELVKNDNHPEARRRLLKLRKIFKAMPEGHWKEQYKKRLEIHDWLFVNEPLTAVKLKALS